MIFIDLYIILMEIKAKVNTEGSLFDFFWAKICTTLSLLGKFSKNQKNPKKIAKTLKKGIDKEGKMW